MERHGRYRARSSIETIPHDVAVDPAADGG
jgi:hypothetical protein